MFLFLHDIFVFEMINELLLPLHSGELYTADFLTLELSPFSLIEVNEELKSEEGMHKVEKCVSHIAI